MELLKEIFEYTGIEIDAENPSIDDFKSQFTSKYINRDNVLEDKELKAKVNGSVYGGINTKIKRKFDLDASDFEYEENGKVEKRDLMQVMDIVKSRYEDKIQELNQVIEASSNDEKYSLLKKDFEDRGKAIEEWSEKYNNILTEKETIENNYKNEITSFKVNSTLDSVKQNLPFKSDLTPAERSGFNALINTNFKIGFEQDGEKEVFRIRDKDGSLIPDPKKAGQYLDAETVLKQLAEENKLLRLNNGGEGNPPKTPQEPSGAGSDKKLPPLMQKFAANAAENADNFR